MNIALGSRKPIQSLTVNTFCYGYRKLEVKNK